MDESFNLNWEDGPSVATQEEVICSIENGQLEETHNNEEYVDMCEEVVVQDMVHETVITETPQPEAVVEEVVYMPDNYQSDNVVYMQDEHVLVVQQNEEVALNEQSYMECQVTEEVITDGWVQPQAEERVEVIGDLNSQQDPNTDDLDIPLPVDQDEYTASRPHPCDFCSRRFRKKANLINHMVAHQTDRPHGCNLCGARYIRKCDLMNHLKIHAYAPEPETYEEEDDDINFQTESDEYEKPRKKKSSSKKRRAYKTKIKSEPEEEKYMATSRSYDYVDEDMRLLTEMANNSNRTFDYDNSDYNEAIPPENHPISEPRYPITDPRKPFVCQHCGVGFAREKALASHARIHGGDSPFECETCGDMFWDLALLKEHVRNKHGDAIGRGSYDDDDDEDYVDDEEKYGDFYCQTCGMSFHRQDLLRRHSRIHIKEEYVNDSEFGHVCNVCGDSFPEALDLLAHAEVHARLDIHRCMLCGESFSEEQAMAAHIAQRHSKNMPPNSCMLCGKACKDRRTLLKHSWEHSREKIFSCSKCGKSFHNKARLKRHMMSHRNKAVACDVCGEDFPDGRSLMNHRHSHNNVSGRQFPCRECGKTFGSRSSQQIHIRIHTGERPYGCRFCWKAFADGGTLRKHERIHTGEKPYACAVCPRAFNQRVVLREHIRSHHSGPDPKYGTSLTPYYCTVCNDLFTTSQDLILHLIEHCDLNTAMKRQPQVGPRKYKRRRKLKPHELERLSNRIDKEEPEDRGNMSDSDDNTKRKLGKRNKKYKAPIDDNYESVFQSFENAVQTINNLVNSKPSARGRKKKMMAASNDTLGSVPRPKMIHTQKTRVPVEVNTADGSKIRHKTKTLITRTTPAVISSNLNNYNSDTSRTYYNNEKNGERNRPRTKNVSYHILQLEKYPLATFNNSGSDYIKVEDVQTEKMNNDIVIKEEHIMNKENNMEFTAEMFNNMMNEENPSNSTLGIDGSLNDQVAQNIEIGESVPEAVNEVCIEDGGTSVTCNSIKEDNGVSLDHSSTRGRTKSKVKPVSLSIVKVVKKGKRSGRHNVDNKVLQIVKTSVDSNESVLPDMLVTPPFIKTEPMDTTSLHELAELTMQHAQNQFKCEMCSETFTNRADLLLHVPIHI